eukprot:UN14823
MRVVLHYMGYSPCYVTESTSKSPEKIRMIVKNTQDISMLIVGFWTLSLVFWKDCYLHWDHLSSMENGTLPENGKAVQTLKWSTDLSFTTFLGLEPVVCTSLVLSIITLFCGNCLSNR